LAPDPPDQKITAAAAVKVVITKAAGKVVVATQTVKIIATGIPIDVIGAVGAVNGVGIVRSVKYASHVHLQVPPGEQTIRTQSLNPP